MAKKEQSLAWMIAKPFIGLCLPLCISLVVMRSMSGGSFSMSQLLPDFSQPVISKVSDSLAMSGEQEVYKWQDAQGVWHFSETAPAQAQLKNVEHFTVNANITTIQMPKPEANASDEKSSKNGPQGFVIGQEQGNAKSVGGLASDPMELLEQAKAIAEKMQQRNTELDNL
jgi:hypothetical protein